MSKLGAKERWLILGIINFLLYYTLYMVGIAPIKENIANNKTEIATLQEQYDNDLQTINSKSQYEETINTLTAEKAKEFASSFPDAESENIYVYMVDGIKNNKLTMSNVSVSQEVMTVNDENTGEEVSTGLKNNNISLSLTGDYVNIINFIKNIENLEKTSLLTSLTLNQNVPMNATLNYTFLTVDKGESDTDSTFDHTFGQGAGNAVLFGTSS